MQLPPCLLIGSLSAQYSVYLLPEAYIKEAYLTDKLNGDVTEIRQVIKIAHALQETRAAVVGRLGITDPDEREDKVIDLIVNGRASLRDAIFLAACSSDIDILFGHPQLAKRGRFEWHGEDDYHMAYTQDFVHPTANIVATLDTENNEEHLRLACELVDDYITAQLLLCSFGLYESGFKLADNCGRSVIEPIFRESFNRFRIMDIGELSGDLDKLLASIERQEWREIVHRKEYTQLPDSVQHYFNEALATRFTKAAVLAVWDKGASDQGNPGAIYGEPSYMKDSMMENNIPLELPLILWRNARQAQSITGSVIDNSWRHHTTKDPRNLHDTIITWTGATPLDNAIDLFERRIPVQRGEHADLE